MWLASARATRRIARILALSNALLLLTCAAAHGQSSPPPARIPIGGVGLPFILNQGQLDARVAYYAPVFAGTVFVTHQGQLVYRVPGRPADASDAPPRPGPPARGRGASLTETFRGGSARLAGHGHGVTRVSSFIGNDPARWRRAIPTYDEVGLGEVWAGVAVSLRARGRSVEKVFTVAPGASVDRIRIRVGGARALKVDGAGALVASTPQGDVAFTAPIAYQERHGVRRSIPVAYRLTGREYGFSVGTYEPDLPLVIDPLVQSSYLGGSGLELAHALAIDATTGDVYVAGTTDTFPGTAGGAQSTIGGAQDVFVARFDRSLTTLIQATYLGGSGNDAAHSIAIQPATGDVYVAGTTQSADFPGTPGGAQPASIDPPTDVRDGFVARLNGSLTTLIQATYLGGSGLDAAYPLAINPTTGDVYVAGVTASADFPVTAGGAQPAYGGGTQDAFVARFDGGLTSLIRATYLGGNGTFELAFALAIQPMTGDVYVAGYTDATNFPGTPGGAQATSGGGWDAFVARLSSTLSVLTQATYLGGSGDEAAYGIAIHPATGNVYVAGDTSSVNFPSTAGGAQASYGGDIQDAFIARLTGGLTLLVQATYLGGAGRDVAKAVALHPATGDVYAAGWTNSTTFPGTAGGAQAAYGGGLADGYIARLAGSLTSLTQTTYLGGSAFDEITSLAFHPATGELYVAGDGFSTDFPGTAGGAQEAIGGGADGLVARLTHNLRLDQTDVTIVKTHGESFFQGQVGATYAITVSNVGTVPTDGTEVTVTDTVPAGLTATALGGSGWSCDLAALTCTRSDVLAGESSYPAITVTVDVAADASATVTNTATVAGGGDVNPGNNATGDPTTVLADTFADVPTTHPFFRWIAALVAAGFTSGCSTSPPLYCPDGDVTRAQMAVFVLRAIHGAGYEPPAATGAFADVPVDDLFAPWIEQLSREGITRGCSTNPPRYCPDVRVTRAEMAVFLLRAKHSAVHQPPAPVGIFADVSVDDALAGWIEQLFAEGITGGCGTAPARYCPGAAVTRGQMAVFLVRAFDLPR